MTTTDRTCAIVGAGMTGLTAANHLAANGWKVTVFDKGRGPGGRMATRRIGTSRFDHGAQFMTVRDTRFAAAVSTWVDAGVVRDWFTHEGHTRYIGVDGMNGIAKHLARDLDVRLHTRVTCIEQIGGRWSITTQGEEGPATGNTETGLLIMTAPSEQSLALCEPFRRVLGRRAVQILQGIHYEPCYALMLLIDGRSLVPAPGLLKPESAVLSLIADNGMKGVSKGDAAALTLHAHGRFTTEHWESAPAEVATRMIEAASAYLGGAVVEWQLHRWRYSQPVTSFERNCLAVKCPLPIFFAGDAFGGPRVEGAFLSGLETAAQILSAQY